MDQTKVGPVNLWGQLFKGPFPCIGIIKWWNSPGHRKLEI